MHNGSVSSDASEGSNGDTSDGFPGYVHTARTSDLTNRNGGGQGWGCQNTMISIKRKDKSEFL
jgi:hypothetical protein